MTSDARAAGGSRRDRGTWSRRGLATRFTDHGPDAPNARGLTFLWRATLISLYSNRAHRLASGSQA